MATSDSNTPKQALGGGSSPPRTLTTPNYIPELNMADSNSNTPTPIDRGEQS